MLHPRIHMRPSFNPSLYLVTDRDLARGRPLHEVVAAAVAGGVTMVQLREKHCSTRMFMAEALALLPLLRAHGVPLLINDRVDVALAVGADGVHLGQEDMPPAAARTLLGPDALIGLTLDTPEQAAEVDMACVDYVGISAYASTTKTDVRYIFVHEEVRRLRRTLSVPIVAIGGINAGNAAALVRAGADGVAVVSAIMAADDPRTASAELLAAVRAAQTRDQ